MPTTLKAPSAVPQGLVTLMVASLVSNNHYQV
jgi:hypothetical protein